ncbi:hypothetical protein N9Y92_00180 [Chlamydiales bacterium]|nr:hypothetical protein [Chlamydiales bacterium]
MVKQESDELLTKAALEIAEKEFDTMMASGKPPMEGYDLFIKTKSKAAYQNLQEEYTSFESDMEKAVELISERILSLPDEKKLPLLEQLENAAEHFDAHQNDEAFFQEIFGFSNDSMSIIYEMASHDLKSDKNTSAEVLFRFLAFLNPSVVPFWVGHGMALVNLDKLDTAVDIFTKGTLANPDDPLPRTQLVNLYLKMDHIPEAKHELEELERIALGDQYQELREEISQIKNTLN